MRFIFNNDDGINRKKGIYQFYYMRGQASAVTQFTIILEKTLLKSGQLHATVCQMLKRCHESLWPSSSSSRHNLNYFNHHGSFRARKAYWFHIELRRGDLEGR
jgi:hypothetical protein